MQIVEIYECLLHKSWKLNLPMFVNQKESLTSHLINVITMRFGMIINIWPTNLTFEDQMILI